MCHHSTEIVMLYHVQVYADLAASVLLDEERFTSKLAALDFVRDYLRDCLCKGVYVHDGVSSIWSKWKD